jgi:glycerophosphoryl diester phosphodiesterase
MHAEPTGRAPVLWPWGPGRPNRAPGLPRIVGHRGAAGLAPENTLAGLRKAAGLGLAWVEFDVKLARGGEPVLMHDESVTRTTDGRGRAAYTTLAELRRLDAGVRFGAAFRGEKIPTFEEAIACLEELGLGANVEIKPCPGRELETGRVVTETILERWPDSLPPPLISSFSDAALAASRAVAPHLARGLLRGARLPLRWPAQLQALGCATLNVSHRLLGRRKVASIKQRGVPLLAYTVDNPLRATQLWIQGVDSVITDRPDLLLGLTPAHAAAQ